MKRMHREGVDLRHQLGRSMLSSAEFGLARPGASGSGAPCDDEVPGTTLRQVLDLQRALDAHKVGCLRDRKSVV